MPIAAASSPSSSIANRYQVAPNTPHIDAVAIDAKVEARRIGLPDYEPQAHGDLPQHWLTVRFGGRRRLLDPDRADQQRRDDEADRVDEDGDRRRSGSGPGSRLSRTPRTPTPSTTRPRRRWRGRGRRAARSSAGTPVGRVEEGREHGGQQRHEEQQRQRQPATERGERDARQAGPRARGRPRSSPAGGAGGRPTRPPPALRPVRR